MENVLNKEKSIGKFFRYKVDEQFVNYLSVIKYSAEKGEYVTIFFDNRRYDNPCPIEDVKVPQGNTDASHNGSIAGFRRTLALLERVMIMNSHC